MEKFDGPQANIWSIRPCRLGGLARRITSYVGDKFHNLPIS